MSLSLLPRSASLLARSSPSALALLARSASGAAARRAVHMENTVYHNTPFSYQNKRAFTLGYWGIMGTLFAVPFIAAGRHVRKFGDPNA